MAFPCRWRTGEGDRTRDSRSTSARRWYSPLAVSLGRYLQRTMQPPSRRVLPCGMCQPDAHECSQVPSGLGPTAPLNSAIRQLSKIVQILVWRSATTRVGPRHSPSQIACCSRPICSNTPVTVAARLHPAGKQRRADGQRPQERRFASPT